MTNAAAALLFLSLGCALVDWGAVIAKNKPLQYIFKPATMLALIAAALLVEPQDPARRAFFVVALIFSLAGDVFLMLPRDRFIFGLATFLIAHAFYILGIKAEEHHVLPFFFALGAVAAIAVWLLRPVVLSLRARQPKLVTPVIVYASVIAVMVASAFTSDGLVIAAAGLLFFVSDYLIARQRFLTENLWQPVTIMVTYHAAQALFVFALVA